MRSSPIRYFSEVMPEKSGDDNPALIECGEVITRISSHKFKTINCWIKFFPPSTKMDKIWF